MNRTFGLLAGAFFGWMIAYFWKVRELEADRSLEGLVAAIAKLMIPFAPDVIMVTGICGLVGMLIGWGVDARKK